MPHGAECILRSPKNVCRGNAIRESSARVAPIWRGIVFLAGVAAVACAWLAQHPSTSNAVPFWVMIVSLAAVGGAAVAFPPLLVRSEGTAVGEPVRLSSVLKFAAGMLLPAGIAWAIWSTEEFHSTHVFSHAASTWAALLWLFGAVFAIGALRFSAAPPSQPKRTAWRVAMSPLLRLELGIFLLILLAALGLRVWHLGTLPEGVWIDEADNAAGVSRLLHMPFQPIQPTDFNTLPPLHPYVMAFFFWVGGNTLTDVRLASAVFGIMTVLGVYLIGRRVGGPPLGLCAALLTTVAQWDIDFSRFGVATIAAPGSLSLALAAFCVAMLRPTRLWFAVTGLLLGFSLLSYYGAFSVATVGAYGVLAVRLVTDRRYRQKAWPAVLLLPVGMLVAAAPLLTAIGLDAGYALGRLNQTSLFSQYPDWPHRLSGLRANLHAHLLMFTIVGDGNGRHNFPGAPMLDPVTGACFLLGLGMCIRGIRHWFSQLVLLWLATSMLSGIFSVDFEAPQAARTVGAIPPLMLIAALPLAALARAVRHVAVSIPAWGTWRGVRLRTDPERGSLPLWLSLLSAGVAALVVAVPLGVATERNLHQYFVQQASDPSSWADMGGDVAIMGRAIPPLLKQGYSVRIDPQIAGAPGLVYAAGGNSPSAYDPSVPVELPLPSGGIALIIPSYNVDTFANVVSAYPHAVVSALAPRFDSSQVHAHVVLVRPADVAANTGLTASFRVGTQQRTLVHQGAVIPWPVGGGTSGSASLQGTLVATGATSNTLARLRVLGARHTWLTLDGEQWQVAGASTPALHLGAGNHALQVRAEGSTLPAIHLQWYVGLSWVDIPLIDLAVPSVPTGGLLGVYYQGAMPNLPPVLWRVDPTFHVYYQAPPPPTDWPFSVRWRGYLKIARPGNYTLSVDSVGAAQLFVDGASLFTDPGATVKTVSVFLRPGRHAFRIDYTTEGSTGKHIYLQWSPPGQPLSPLPRTVLDPALS